MLKRSKLYSVVASMIVLPWKMLEALKVDAAASALQVCVSRATFEINKMLEVQESVKNNTGCSCVT